MSFVNLNTCPLITPKNNKARCLLNQPNNRKVETAGFIAKKYSTNLNPPVNVVVLSYQANNNQSSTPTRRELFSKVGQSG